MNNTTLLALGIAAGAALLYWLDPERGPRRRAELKHKAIHARKVAEEAAGVTARDLAGRGRGFVAALRAHGEGSDDEVIAERVRSKLGRACSHPRAIHVTCREGRVELTGPVLADELQRVLGSVWGVRGVRELDNRLEPHTTADGVPGLQGEGRPHRLFHESWSPSARLLAGTAGTGLFGWGAVKRGVVGIGVGAGGLLLVLRSLTNLSVRRLVGIGAGRRAIDVQKEIHVHAPPEQVFAFFRQFENFPRFMTHVRNVTRQADGHWRWTVTGPANIPVSWEAEVTQLAPNESIGWKSIGASLVKSAGVVRFEADRGGTRVNIKLSYNPPAGAIGHAFASLLGTDPKKELDDDLLRFKSLLETGKATGRDETVSRDDLLPGR